MYATLFVCALAFVVATYRDPSIRKNSTSRGVSVWAAQAHAILLLTVGFIGAVIAVNGHAVVMQRVLGKNMSWFAAELSPIILYGPSALAGAFASQLLFDSAHERTVFTALLLLLSGGAFVVQMLGIGSAALLFISALPLFVALLVDRAINDSATNVHLLAYALGQISPLTTGTHALCIIFDVFVPLTGRMGGEAPAEHIIATIVAVSLAYTLPLVLPFAHRYGTNFIFYTIIGLHVVLYATAAIFMQRSPFDELHQRRLFILSSDNITSHERYLHIGAADGAPGFEDLVHEISSRFGVIGTSATLEDMSDHNSDWDTLYPFSQFMAPYKVPLPIEPGYVSPYTKGEPKEFTVQAVHDHIDSKAGTRSLTLRIIHPDIIWTVIAFDAHVLKWSLDDAPPDEHTRHHIKEASYYGVDEWTVDLVVKIPPGETSAQLLINYIGIQEKGMWPGKAHVKSEGGHAMALFEGLDGWLNDHTKGTVDAMMLSSVGGIAKV